MPNYATTTIIGHLGKDPELSAAGEHPLCRFSVAVTRKRKSGDITTWWNVTAWRQSATIAAQYLKKGSAVCIVGTPYLESYEKDGVTKQALKLEATDVVLLGRSEGESAPATAARTASTAPKATPPSIDDDLPF